jgi:hypothetical protein
MKSSNMLGQHLGALLDRYGALLLGTLSFLTVLSLAVAGQ